MDRFLFSFVDKKKIMKVYLIYGQSTESPTHWYSWIATRIEEQGAECIQIALPHPENPDYEQYQQILFNQIVQSDQESIFIAHEVGVLSTLDFLSKYLKQIKHVKSLFVISAFHQNLNAKPEYHQFIKKTHILDEIIRANIQQRFLFLSNNDVEIPAPISIELGHLLNAQMFEVKQAGQFRDRDGFTEFPQLWEKVKVALKPTRTRTAQASDIFHSLH